MRTLNGFVDEFVHRIVANAIIRAMKNGTFRQLEERIKNDERSEELETE